MEIIKLGVNKKGINGNVNEYIHYKKYSIKEMKEMEVNTKRFINNKIKEGDEIQLYFYDKEVNLRIQYIEFLKQAIISNKSFTLYLMIFDSKEKKYVKYNVK